LEIEELPYFSGVFIKIPEIRYMLILAIISRRIREPELLHHLPWDQNLPLLNPNQ
jgi:hypothetical protein